MLWYLTLCLMICSELTLASAAQQKVQPATAPAGSSPGQALAPSRTPQATTPPARYLVEMYAKTPATPHPEASPARYLIEIYPKMPSEMHQRSNKGTTPTKDQAKDQVISFAPLPEHIYYGEPFPVKAASESGVPVTIIKLSGPADVVDSTVTLTGPGTLELCATLSRDANCTSPVAVKRKFEIEEDDDFCFPGLLPAQGEKKKSPSSSVSTLIPWLGNPVPFSFEALGKDQIAIYSSKAPTQLSQKEKELVAQIKKTIEELRQQQDLSLPPSAAAAPGPSKSASEASICPSNMDFCLEVAVPHSSALGDIAQKVSSLSSSLFSVQGVGMDKIRISSKKVPSCHNLTVFLQEVRHLAWQTSPESPVAHEYHFQSPSDVVTAFGGGPSGGLSGSKGAAGSPSSIQSAKSSVSGTGGKSGNGSSSTTGADATSAPSGASGSSASESGTGGQSGASDSASSGIPSNASSSQPSGSSGASLQKGSVSVALINPDLFLFSETVPGDDSEIAEKKRILAQLDLPRPEVLINAWGIQATTTDPNMIGEFNTRLNQMVAQYNNGIQQVVNTGWDYLKSQMDSPETYFDLPFYRYITGRYVADLEAQASDKPGESSEQVATDFLWMRSHVRSNLTAEIREKFAICPANQYCLGYTNIFLPLEPRLTDLLVGIIAAKTPWKEACSAIDRAGTECNFNASYINRVDCEAEDTSYYSDFNRGHIDGESPRLNLGCFREKAKELLGGYEPTGRRTTPVGLARAAISDFLFNYKMAQQYPHEFSPYDLTLSAQKLDAFLSPFAEAFNRDVITYQRFLRDEVEKCEKHKAEACKVSDWKGMEKTSLVSDAIVTVRTLSATPTSAGVTTQNFLNDTQAPTLSALLSSTVGAGSAGRTAGSSNQALLELSQLTSPVPVSLLLNALNAAQYSEVQIGKSLKLNVTPHSLSGASSAEIDATMNVNDAVNPTRYTPTQGKSSDANISRVANHEVTTRVRVDSLKLFDVSSFSAALQRSRSRFPLLPLPGVEVPYIGSIVGIPLPGAKEYHSSMFVISAIVVPTAADLAFGLTFVSDRLVDATHAGKCDWPDTTPPSHPYFCTVRKATSLADFGNAPIRTFNKLRVACLATGNIGGYSTLGQLQDGGVWGPPKPPDSSACEKLNLDSVPRDADPTE